MSMKRKMDRAAKQRAAAAMRFETRPTRRAAPQRRADAAAKQAAQREEHHAWLASLTPEQRERYKQRVEERGRRQMEMCAPVLAMAASMAMRG